MDKTACRMYILETVIRRKKANSPEGVSRRKTRRLRHCSFLGAVGRLNHCPTATRLGTTLRRRRIPRTDSLIMIVEGLDGSGLAVYNMQKHKIKIIK